VVTVTMDVLKPSISPGVPLVVVEEEEVVVLGEWEPGDIFGHQHPRLNQTSVSQQRKDRRKDPLSLVLDLL
jgi:hypothetical protein